MNLKRYHLIIGKVCAAICVFYSALSGTLLFLHGDMRVAVWLKT